MRLGSHIGLETICLGLGPLGLVSGLGPLRHVETFMQARVVHTVAAVRAILTSMTFVAYKYSFSVLLFHLLIYYRAELCHVSLFSS